MNIMVLMKLTKHQSFALIAIALLIIDLTALYWYHGKDALIGKTSLNNSQQNIEEFNSQLTLPVPVVTLSNWYMHHISKANIIYTRTKELPNIGATEGYAYGEQIYITVMPFDGRIIKPEEWEQISWISDEAMVNETEWKIFSDFKTLRVRHEAGGASGEQVTFYLFAKDRVYNISVYPVDEKNELEFTDFVYKYAKQLRDEQNQL